VDGEGRVKLQWLKSSEDPAADKIERLRELIEEFDWSSIESAGVRPTPDAEHLSDELLDVYPMGDPHVGMLAWSKETGDDFDHKIARRDLASAFDHLATLPRDRAREALIVNLGDFFHSDDPSNRTRRSGANLDVDSRWAKVLQVGLDIMVHAVDVVRQLHEKVTVWCLIGNHDDCSSQFLALALNAYYREDPRVTIETSPAKFLWHRFGKVLIGGAHGDTTKPAQLKDLMAVDRAADWGETEFRYWLVGHVHHDRRVELPGCMVESFRTLAPRDAWHAAQGYRSGQDMKLITYHREYGEINRHTVGIKQLRSK
jgi:DNA repair exonuclease SbcCD nuclease subunit